MGGGLEVSFTEWDFTYSNEEEEEEIFGDLLFFIDCKYLFGSRAKYLKEGSIQFSNPEDGPVETTFNWTESATDLLQINVGIGVKIK